MTDPERHYRTMAVLFVDFAAAVRGITAADYFQLYRKGGTAAFQPDRKGLFNKSGIELVSDEALALVKRKTRGEPLLLATIMFARKHGEAGLDKLLKMGAAEDHVFGD